MPIEVYLSDAIALLKTLPPKSVHVIATDPPYGIAYHSNHYKGKNPHTPVMNDWNFEPDLFFQVAADVLQDGGAMYIFTRWDMFPIWAGLLPPSLILKNAIVWAKDNWSAGDLDGDFGYQYEIIMFIVKGRHLRVGHRFSNVWTVPRIPFKKLLHPTEKPVELFDRILNFSVRDGDLVVDPFCGSGPLGVAVKKRNAIDMVLGKIDQGSIRVVLGDIDPKMIRITCNRLDLPLPTNLPQEALVRLPPCPVFRMSIPDPHLWGIHPEDLAYFKGKEDALHS
jgi:site-specific DNA-methyltransferase (adenine-specific)